MKVKFKELYDAVRETRTAVDAVGLDLDNIAVSETVRCILTAEQNRLADSFMELSNAAVTLEGIDINEIQSELNDCMDECINLVK